MKLSVVIPAYNEERYLRRCLQSLSEQVVVPDEIIIVDNNSTDNTVAIAQEFPTRIIRESRQGIIYARNTGFDHACFELIARTDADTLLPHDWIKKIQQNFRNQNIAALTGPLAVHDLKTTKRLTSRSYLDFMRLLQHGKETLQGPNMALTKAIWQKVRNKLCLDATKVHEDVDLAIHICAAGGHIGRDNSLVVFTSARRLKNKPFSFFGEYPLRLVKTLVAH